MLGKHFYKNKYKFRKGNIMINKYIENFFKATKVLKDEKVIRSDRYLGDIGEYICQVLYGLELNESGGREVLMD